MPLRINTPMPDLDGATEWVNGEVKREELIGYPTLVHFWAKSCPICHDNMPTVQHWLTRYADRGLKLVAVHMPREEEDTHLEAVRADIAALEVQEPCAIDNRHAIGERFDNQFWPSYFLFDSEGFMRSRSAGEAGLKMMEAAIKRLFEPSEGTPAK